MHRERVAWDGGITHLARQLCLCDLHILRFMDTLNAEPGAGQHWNGVELGSRNSTIL